VILIQKNDMKRIHSKKMILKKVTVSTFKIYGAGEAPTYSNEDPIDETLSSAYGDPTEFPINPLFLSRNATLCA